MTNILFVHQSSEMYGSDKTLLVLVSEFKKKGLNPIVVLPGSGPLEQALHQENITVYIAPVFKISRKMFTPANMMRLPSQIIKAIRLLDKINKQHKIDLVYSNTLAVLIGIIYAKRRKLKHIWHVHEIIESPKPVVKIFKKALVSKANSWTIYNSEATRDFWNKGKEKLSKKSAVVCNGLTPCEISLSEDEKNTIRKTRFSAGKEDIVIALVGRISRWKGQQLLAESFDRLAEKYSNIRLVFVGSPPPNQEIHLENLEKKLQAHNLEGKTTILPFQDDIGRIWEAIDIAVVPSTEPEPFGLVALEAMLASKPVVGANHGGLTEIIVNNETGFLFEPNNVTDLTQCLATLICEADKRKSFGKNGFQRATTVFSLENYVSQIHEFCLAQINQKQAVK